MRTDEIFVIVGKQKSGERDCDDQSDQTEKCPPDGERKENYGRIHAHGFADDFRSEHKILYRLHDTVDGDHLPEQRPETDLAADGYHHTYKCGGYKRNELEIGHHVEQSDEHAQDYGHRQTDNKEADTEQYTYDERHQCLSAEIVVHGTFDIAAYLEHYPAVFGHDHPPEPRRNLFIVEHDEDHI